MAITTLDIAFFVIIILATFGLAYFYSKITKDLIEIIFYIYNRHQFFKSLTNLFKLDPTLQNIIDLFKSIYQMNEKNPKFLMKLEILLDDYKTFLINKDKRYFKEQINDDVALRRWIDQINNLKSQMKEKYPFSGLFIEEIALFEDTYQFINSNTENEIIKENLIRKVKELGGIVSLKDKELLSCRTRFLFRGFVLRWLGRCSAFCGLTCIRRSCSWAILAPCH